MTDPPEHRHSAVSGAATGPSSTVPDWSREQKPFGAWDPPRALLASIRAWQRHAGSNWPHAVLARKFAVLRYRWWSAVCGADIPIGCRIEGGLLLPHPNGIVVHSDARIGPNCLLFQQVTLAGGAGGAPVLGGHVDVGAGARIIGAVRIGDHAVVGANAVVTCDVPPGVTVVGIPARPIARTATGCDTGEARGQA